MGNSRAKLTRGTLGICAPLVMALGVTACGGEESETKAEAKEPELTSIRVILVDRGEGFFLNNRDNTSTCTTYDPFLDGPDGDAPITLELEDADGTALDSEQIQGTGGTWGDRECTWTMRFGAVQAEDRYRIRVKSPIRGEVEQIIEGDEVTVDVSNPTRP